MRSKNTLYNVLFPIWFLILIPISWLIVLPANFVWDSIVLLIALALFRTRPLWKSYISAIWKTWLLGFAADIIGALPMTATLFINSDGWFYDTITAVIASNPFGNIYAFFYTAVCIAVSAIMIYLFNSRVSFKNAPLSIKQKKAASFALVVFTAPYFYLFPMLFY